MRHLRENRFRTRSERGSIIVSAMLRIAVFVAVIAGAASAPQGFARAQTAVQPTRQRVWEGLYSDVQAGRGRNSRVVDRTRVPGHLGLLATVSTWVGGAVLPSARTRKRFSAASFR